MATTMDSAYAPRAERPTLARLAVVFIIGVLIATVWGAIVQTQFNLAALAGLGVDISGSVRFGTTLRDIFSTFSLTYGAYVVLPSLLVAFLVCGWLVRYLPGHPVVWFVIAGYGSIPIGNAIVNFLAPVALLVGATRDLSCTLLMAIGGALAGLLVGWAYARRQPVRPRYAHRRSPPPPDL